MGAPGTAAYYEDRDRRNRHRYARQSIGADALSGAAYLLEGLGDWRRQRQKDADEEATAQLFSQMMASPEGVPLAEGESGPNVSWNQALAERSGQYRAPGFLDKLGQTFVGGYEGQVRPTQAMGLQQMYAQMQAQQQAAGHQQEMRGFERQRVGFEGERVGIAGKAEERAKAEAAAKAFMDLQDLDLKKTEAHARLKKESTGLRRQEVADRETLRANRAREAETARKSGFETEQSTLGIHKDLGEQLNRLTIELSKAMDPRLFSMDQAMALILSTPGGDREAARIQQLPPDEAYREAQKASIEVLSNRKNSVERELQSIDPIRARIIGQRAQAAGTTYAAPPAAGGDTLEATLRELVQQRGWDPNLLTPEQKLELARSIREMEASGGPGNR